MEFEEMVKVLVNSKPITYKQIKEQHIRFKFPYEETAEILNNLSSDKYNEIPDIIHKQELKVFKKVGIKKLLGMIKNKDVKDKIKERYCI